MRLSLHALKVYVVYVGFLNITGRRNFPTIPTSPGLFMFSYCYQHGGFDIGCGLLQMALRMTKRFLVLLPPYRRILDKSDDTEMESAVRAFFSDVLETGDNSS